MTPYPVRLLVPPSSDSRNRLTVAFRPILAIPHIILIGPIWSPRGGGPGLLGAAAYFLAIVNWFSMVFTGTLVPGSRELRPVLPAVASPGDGVSGDDRRSVPAVQ